MEWIDANERLPDDGTYCLAYIPNVGIFQARYNAHEYTYEFGGVNMTYVTSVTHWIPIPAFPEVD